MSTNKKLQISIDFEIYELIMLQSCINSEINRVRDCNFEDEFEPMNYTKPEVIEKLYELKDKVSIIKC